MRFREFNLTESDQTEINQDLDQLTNAALKNPAKSDKIKSGLLKILNFVKNKSKQTVQTKPNTQPTNSLVPTTQKTAISDPNDTIAEDLGTDIKAISSGIKSLLPNLSPKDLKILMAELEKQRREAFELGKEEAKRIYTQLDGHIAKVLERIGEGSNKRKIAEFREMFQDDNITPDEAKAFLEAAANGKVIDMVSLVNSPSGGVGEHIWDYVKNPKIRETFKKISLDFFNIIPAKTGGAIGPGEIAFILLGNPTEKVSKGDLKIGNEKFEIKASGTTVKVTEKGKKTQKTGAILGGDKLPNAKSKWHTVKQILSKYKMPNIEIIGTRGTGKGTKVPNYKLIPMGFSAFNHAFSAMKMPLETRVNLLYDILNELYPDVVTTNTKKELSTLLSKNNGLLDTDMNGTFMRYIALQALNTYRLDPDKDNFLFFNKNKNTFRVYRGKDLNKSLLNTKSDLRIIKGIDWNDGQMKVSPGIYLD